MAPSACMLRLNRLPCGWTTDWPPATLLFTDVNRHGSSGRSCRRCNPLGTSVQTQRPAVSRTQNPTERELALDLVGFCAGRRWDLLMRRPSAPLSSAMPCRGPGVSIATRLPELPSASSRPWRTSLRLGSFPGSRSVRRSGTVHSSSDRQQPRSLAAAGPGHHAHQSRKHPPRSLPGNSNCPLKRFKATELAPLRDQTEWLKVRRRKSRQNDGKRKPKTQFKAAAPSAEWVPTTNHKRTLHALVAGLTQIHPTSDGPSMVGRHGEVSGRYPSD